MTTATGEFAFNFATHGNENPFVDANFTDLLAGDAQVNGGVLIQTGFAHYLMAYTAGTYDGGPVTVSAEVNATASDDEVLLGVLDENGDGFVLEVSPTGVFVLVYTAYAVTDSAGTAAITFTADDLFTFAVTKGSPNTYAATQNGTPITLSQSSEAKTLSNLRGAWGFNVGNVGAGSIKSLAVVDGLTVGGGGTGRGRLVGGKLVGGNLLVRRL
jgi:hypothetical protein